MATRFWQERVLTGHFNQNWCFAAELSVFIRFSLFTKGFFQDLYSIFIRIFFLIFYLIWRFSEISDAFYDKFYRFYILFFPIFSNQIWTFSDISERSGTAQMTDPRWWIFEMYDVILAWYDVIIDTWLSLKETFSDALHTLYLLTGATFWHKQLFKLILQGLDYDTSSTCLLWGPRLIWWKRLLLLATASWNKQGRILEFLIGGVQGFSRKCEVEG